ncbi:DUF350 domain-containing protein [Roseomonas sp. CCTCC AB2023176]|uniref:DUF350 domain-containing protein n=1 Tax=Roseomonas sp. CCTCC AB2023176 TaxID=3342640 RepID=UPI0035DFD35D
MTSLATLPNFLLHLVVGLAIVVAGAWAYIRMTPHDEMRLIATGNSGAAVKLAGTLIGFGLPVSQAIRSSINVLDALVWGVIALVAQILVFVVITRVLPDWRAAMEQRGEVAGAILYAGAAITVGMVNAGCLTP